MTIHETGSVTAAAARLGRAQSTLSYALNCARAAFGDELFVREGHHLAPTPRCLHLMPRIGGILRELEAMAVPDAFDPDSHGGEITLSCNQYEQSILLPGLVAHLRRHAPNLSLKIIRSHTGGQEQLLSGECDILLSPLPCDRLDVYGAVLFSDFYLCVYDGNHVRLPEEMTLDDYLECNHVGITHGGNWRPFFLDTLPGSGPGSGRALKVVLRLCSATNLFDVLPGTDLVANIPSRLARNLDPVLKAVPGPFETRFDTYLYYTRRTRDHAVARWVRDAIVAIARNRPPAGR